MLGKARAHQHIWARDITAGAGGGGGQALNTVVSLHPGWAECRPAPPEAGSMAGPDRRAETPEVATPGALTRTLLQLWRPPDHGTAHSPDHGSAHSTAHSSDHSSKEPVNG